MKKVALFAALLAFTMMGCSESGLDNSIASTTASDAQGKQAENNAEFPLVLKKVGAPVSCGTGMDKYSCQITYHHPYDGLYYTISLSSGVHRDRDVSGSVNVSVKDYQNNLINNSKADFLHVITVGVCGCRIVGTQLKCEDDYKSEYLFESNVMFTTNNVYNYRYNRTEELSQCEANRIGTVSNYAVVYNAGTSTELILAGNTFEGPMFHNMSDESARNLAIRVMQKYILEPYGN